MGINSQPDRLDLNDIHAHLAKTRDQSPSPRTRTGNRLNFFQYA